jgi:hypothetical protein
MARIVFRAAPHKEVPSMYRPFAICLVLGTVHLCVACDKGDADSHAGAEKADAAPSDLAKAREEYLRQKQADLSVLDRSIAGVEAKENALTAAAKTDYHGVLSSLKATQEAFAGDLRAADTATASTWDATKARLDKEWADLKAATDKAASMPVPAARARHKPAEMTCEEFVALADVEKPKVLYWAEGFNKQGKAVDSVVDVSETDRWLPLVVAECTKSPKESVSKIVAKHASAAPKPAAAAPAPAKMKCSDYVVLDDVVKPKVVYWAEGFDKAGKATDAVVDIDETDRLVPVLVQECKETPKLTLWERIKKHL